MTWTIGQRASQRRVLELEEELTNLRRRQLGLAPRTHH